MNYCLMHIRSRKMLCYGLVLLVAEACLSLAQDYATCTVPQTTVIDQLRARVSSLEQVLSANLTARINLLEGALQEVNLELEIQQNHNRILNETIEQLQENIQTLSANQDAALERERTLQDPDWYTAFNGFQYRLTQTSQSWDASRLLCTSLGGSLASTGIQNNAMRMQIAQALGIEQAWIGLTDQEEEGSWMWIDGVMATRENTDWSPGEPSNSGGDQNCGEIWGRNFNFRLNDDQCHKEQIALCERRLDL